MKGMSLLIIAGVAALCACVTAGAETLSLPEPRMAGGRPVLSALKVRHSTRDFKEDALPKQLLSDLLWAAFGVNRPDSGMRTAPSSYNWQDITLYVFTAEAAYTYDAANNQLIVQKEGDHRALAGMQGYVKAAPVSIVYVSDTSTMKHGDDTYSDEYKLMIGCLDAGHIAQNVYLFCASEDLGAVSRASVDRKAFAKAFNLPEYMNVIFGQTVGYPNEE